MAEKIKYHLLTGDHSGKNPPRTIESEDEDAVIEEAKKAGDIIRVQSSKTLKYVWEKPADAEKPAEKK